MDAVLEVEVVRRTRAHAAMLANRAGWREFALNVEGTAWRVVRRRSVRAVKQSQKQKAAGVVSNTGKRMNKMSGERERKYRTSARRRGASSALFS